MGKRKQHRVGLTAWAYVGRDDDLIAYFNKHKKSGGDKMPEILRLLRLALGIPDPKPSVYESLTADDINALVQHELDKKMAKHTELMERRFDEMYSALMKNIPANLTNYVGDEQTIYESVMPDRVDEETLAERKQNMMKDEW